MSMMDWKTGCDELSVVRQWNTAHTSHASKTPRSKEEKPQTTPTSKPLR
jgi:hypothetical protein